MHQLNTILNNQSELLTSSYFKLQSAAEKLYGKNTVILIEVGSFYEIYESDTVGKAKEISKLLNILLTRKNKSIDEISERYPCLCGIPSVSLEKHMDKIISENKWTIILVNQEGEQPNIKRKISKIISPGTNTDFLQSDDSNYIAAISIEKNQKDIFYASIVLLEPSLGKTLIFENAGTSNDPKSPIDEIEQIIRTHNIKETLFLSNDLNESEIISLFKFDNYSFRQLKELKISYQEELLSKVFNAKGFYSAIEDLNLERHPLATTTLVYLLDFIIEHNKFIATNLLYPEIINTNKFMYLGNNPMQQLDIINDDISVIKIVNKGITAIGKRFITEQILHPLTDQKEIFNRLSISEEFTLIDTKPMESILKEIYDIERIWRKIDLESISPFELHNLYVSFRSLLKIDVEHLKLDKEVINNICKQIETSFDINLLSKFNMANIDRNFVLNNKEINILCNQLSEKEQIINNIQKDLSAFAETTIQYTETEGYSFEITFKRLESSKDEIIKILSKYGEIKEKHLKSSTKFYVSSLKNLSEEISVIKSKIIYLNKKVFLSFVSELKTKENIDAYKESVLFISLLDFYINNANLYKKNYCIPSFVESENNFYEANKLRHPIVETIEENGIFIPNNVILGDKALSSLDTEVLYNKENDTLNGFLLYGINSAGKTVLSKSVGISIILAQAGMFVPATSLRLSLYDAIFTRISGSDNLIKGLSTFAIEMLELKNIFNRASSKSIVLGDEISHGTETVSGVSIVASSIIFLNKLKCSFILATHLHQLDDIDEIAELKTVSNVHLSILYDEHKDTLIYNRTLQKGSGSSVYGLEFAKSLKLPKEFLDKAYEIRKKFDSSELELLTKKKLSNYNSDVYMASCAICGEKAIDTHHINEQNLADEKGFIESFHKNHKYNLIPVCKKCHSDIHDGKIIINGWSKLQKVNS